MKNIENQILRLIDNANSILIMPSSPPDGDSLGSAVAMYLALRAIGKSSTVVCADPVPDVFQFLPMVNTITDEFTPTPDFIVTLNTENAELASLQSQVEESKINIIFTAKKGRFSADQVSFSHGANRYDLIITVDTASPQQLGRFYEDNLQLFQEIPVINIDHHASNEYFGRLNYVDIMSSSTTEMILGLIEAMEEEKNLEIVDAEIGTLLLSGIITDTGSFQNSNTNPKSFANSAKLIKRGARQQEIIQHVYKTKQLSTLRLWGRTLSNIRVEKSHRFLWSVITRKDLAETGSKADETGSIVDELLSNAPDTDIVLLLKEKDDGTLSGSMRTMSENIDASEIAALFGGGGHPKAAGFKIKNTTFAEQGDQVIARIKEYQAKRLNLNEQSFQQINAADLPGLEMPATTITKDKKNSEETSKDSARPDENKISKLSKGNTRKIESGVLYKFEE